VNRLSKVVGELDKENKDVLQYWNLRYGIVGVGYVNPPLPHMESEPEDIWN
jgi:hypothetical protein